MEKEASRRAPSGAGRNAAAATASNAGRRPVTMLAHRNSTYRASAGTTSANPSVVHVNGHAPAYSTSNVARQAPASAKPPARIPKKSTPPAAAIAVFAQGRSTHGAQRSGGTAPPVRLVGRAAAPRPATHGFSTSNEFTNVPSTAAAAAAPFTARNALSAAGRKRVGYPQARGVTSVLESVGIGGGPRRVSSTPSNASLLNQGLIRTPESRGPASSTPGHPGSAISAAPMNSVDWSAGASVTSSNGWQQQLHQQQAQSSLISHQQAAPQVHQATAFVPPSSRAAAPTAPVRSKDEDDAASSLVQFMFSFQQPKSIPAPAPAPSHAAQTSAWSSAEPTKHEQLHGDYATPNTESSVVPPPGINPYQGGLDSVHSSSHSSSSVGAEREAGSTLSADEIQVLAAAMKNKNRSVRPEDQAYLAEESGQKKDGRSRAPRGKSGSALKKVKGGKRKKVANDGPKLAATDTTGSKRNNSGAVRGKVLERMEKSKLTQKRKRAGSMASGVDEEPDFEDRMARNASVPAGREEIDSSPPPDAEKSSELGRSHRSASEGSADPAPSGTRRSSRERKSRRNLDGSISAASSLKRARRKREAELFAAVGTPDAPDSMEEAEDAYKTPSPKIVHELPPKTASSRKKPKKLKSAGKGRCGHCESCQVEDCGECEHCLDKPRFGGRGTKRQRCIHKGVCYNFSSSTFSPPPKPDNPSTAVSTKKVTEEAVAEKPTSSRRTARTSRAGRRSAPQDGDGDGDDDSNETEPELSAKIALCQPSAAPGVSSMLGNDSFVIEEKPEELEPMTPPPKVPDFPQTGFCDWSFDETSRVLLANFRRKEAVKVCREDEEFLLKMMERNDLTVVSEGLADELDPFIWDLNNIAGCVGDEYYHRIRRFQRKLVPESTIIIKAQEDSATGDSEDTADVKERPRPEKSGPEAKTDDDSVQEEDRCYVAHDEMDGNLSLRVSDYVKYLGKRRKALEAISQRRRNAGLDPINPNSLEDDVGRGRLRNTNSDTGEEDIGYSDEEEEMDIIGHDGTVRRINVVNDVLYLIDYDMMKLLPSLSDNFSKSFKMPNVMPGGSHCMMNAVNSNGRPFMGPNLYISPPASFTHFHQDGHGTVDSGHQCLSGYNEVVMLRRLPEYHKRHALHLLNGEDRRVAYASDYDALYGLPHGDGLGAKPMWPDSEAIRKCKEMNYCPSVFVLKPGQLVHINKGRLHAFRKLAPTALPKSDCHAEVRAAIIKDNDLGDVEQICMSVAWDWMFKGVTAVGIHHEIDSVLKCAQLNRMNGRQSLAIPETSLLQMARVVTSAHERGATDITRTSDVRSRAPMFNFLSKEARDDRFEPTTHEVLKGIHHSLKYIVTRHTKALAAAEESKEKSTKLERVSLSMRPNTWENPEIFALDPYGNGDFFCRLCGYELSNIYMHCDGCEEILNKDFNICVSCHGEGRHKRFEQMHPLNKKRHSTINHTGDFEKCRQSRCPCKNGPICKACTYCAGCSCKCHRWFTLHVRFMKVGDESKLLKRVEDALGSDTLSPEDCILQKFLSFEEKRRALQEQQKQEQEQEEKEKENGLAKVENEAAVATHDGPEQPAPAATPTTTPVAKDTTTPPSTDVPSEEVISDADALEYTVGRTVEVRPRRGPGLRDKPGGIGRITKVHLKPGDDSRITSVDVKYVMGGRDKVVPVRYLRIAAEYERSGSRRGAGSKGPRPSIIPSPVGKTQDWSCRSSDLISTTIVAQKPTSSADLSSAALAFTAPCGEMAAIERGSKLEGGLGNKHLEEFLKAARKLESPTIDQLRSILPKWHWLKSNQLHHLFRNFCDAKEITGEEKFARVNITRREIDIINYFIAEEKDFRDCFLLMPYRNVVSVSKLYKFLKKKRFTKTIPGYRDHITEKVGVIMKLERVENSSNKKGEPDSGKGIGDTKEGKDYTTESAPSIDECSDGGADKTLQPNGSQNTSTSNRSKADGDIRGDENGRGTKVSDLCAAEVDSEHMIYGDIGDARTVTKQSTPTGDGLSKKNKKTDHDQSNTTSETKTETTQRTGGIDNKCVIDGVTVALECPAKLVSRTPGKGTPESSERVGEKQGADHNGDVSKDSPTSTDARKGANCSSKVETDEAPSPTGGAKAVKM